MNTRTLFSQSYRVLIAPQPSTDDRQRRQFILSILLLGFVVLLSVAFIVEVSTLIGRSALEYTNDSIGILVVGTILAFFVFLYVSARKGLITFPGYALVLVLFGLAAYLGMKWGVDLPMAIVFYPLSIIIAGIVIDTRVAFLFTILSGVSLTVIGYAQEIGLLSTNSYWRTERWELSDTITIVIIYVIIAIVAWLSNREIQRSLKRAYSSEKELREERDQLEVRVQQRTAALRAVEMEKMSQTYRFVEFGRIASGLFHDLSNPLTALSLTIDSIEASRGDNDPQKLALLTGDVSRARSAAAHMQRLMDSMRRYLAREGNVESFSVQAILEEIRTVLSSYAMQRSVQVAMRVWQDIELTGDPVAFTQVITNIISNAIESFSPQESEQEVRTIDITLTIEETGACITVQDSGSGIPEDMRESIFEAFVSTKSIEGGLGIGLSLARRIIERQFNGTVTVESVVGEGSTFAIYFPIREP